MSQFQNVSRLQRDWIPPVVYPALYAGRKSREMADF